MSPRKPPIWAIFAFQCSSASRKFLNRSRQTARTGSRLPFQCSSASRKFLNVDVEVWQTDVGVCFSALQRAENSSIAYPALYPQNRTVFQCSSASRKFLNWEKHRKPDHVERFQCSSASRKFLNRPACCLCGNRSCFSALQRAENSSMVRRLRNHSLAARFSALQRAENSSIGKCCRATRRQATFQCSSASRKFLNVIDPTRFAQNPHVSVLFSEPKIPQRLVGARQAVDLRVSVLFSEPKIPQ